MRQLAMHASLALPALLLFPLLAGCAVAPADGSSTSSDSALTYKPLPPRPLMRDRGVSVQYTNAATGAVTSAITLHYDGVSTTYYYGGALVADFTVWDDLDQVESSTDCYYHLFAASGPYGEAPAFMSADGPVLCSGAAYSGSEQIPANLLTSSFLEAVGEPSAAAVCAATNNQGTSVTFTTYLFAGVSGIPTGTSGPRWMDAIVGNLTGTAPMHPDVPAPSQTLTVTLGCD